jgi:hypothetical protein
VPIGTKPLHGGVIKQWSLKMLKKNLAAVAVVVGLVLIASLLVATTFAHAKTKPQNSGWFCEVTDNGVKLYKAKGGGAKRKRDAVCE